MSNRVVRLSKKRNIMKKFILSLMAMTVIGTSTISAQRNNNRYNEVRDSHRTEMRHNANNRKTVIVEKTVVVRDTPRPVAAHHARPVVVHHAPVPPRPVVVEHRSTPSVGAVVAGAVIGAVLTSMLSN